MIKDKIFIYDVFTELNDQYCLNPSELYLYCYLYTLRNHSQAVKTSIELIHQAIPIKFHNSRPNINRARIKEELITLKEKGVLSFDIKGQSLDKRNGKDLLLTIYFEKLREQSGYIQLDHNEFNRFNDMYKFYIFIAIKRYDHVKYNGNGLYGRWISEKEFSTMLNVSKETFRKHMNEMIRQKQIFKLTGNRTEDSKERDKNRYRTIPFPKETKSTFENRYDGNSSKQRRETRNKYTWGENPF